MRRRRFLACVGATAAATSGCTGLLEGADAFRFRYVNDGPLAGLAATPDTVYVAGDSQTDPGHVVAIDAATGETRWTRATVASGNTLTLAARQGTLLVWTTATLTMSAMEGFADTPWHRSGVASFPPPAADDVVYLHRNNSVEAVDRTGGDRRWRVRPTGPHGNRPIPRPELVLDGVVVAATWSGYLLGLDDATGDRRWWAFTRNVGPRVAVGDGTVFVGGEYRRGRVRVDRLDPRTGAHETVAAFQNRHATPILATGDGLVVQTHGAPGDALVHIDPGDGERRWRVTGLSATPASADAELVVAYDVDRDRVVALDPVTGARRWGRAPPPTDAGVDLAMTADIVLVRGASTVVGLSRRDGSDRFRLSFDPDALGQPRLATTPDAAYLVIGSTLYALPG